MSQAALGSDGGQRKQGPLRVAETVVFARGAPVCWLFTDKRGRVRRRHARRLLHQQ